jgi:hypothetical protein
MNAGLRNESAMAQAEFWVYTTAARATAAMQKIIGTALNTIPKRAGKFRREATADRKQREERSSRAAAVPTRPGTSTPEEEGRQEEEEVEEEEEKGESGMEEGRRGVRDSTCSHARSSREEATEYSPRGF